MKEYLKKLLAAKKAKQAEMTMIYKKSVDNGETPSEEDATLIATLKAEIDVIAANIANVQTLIADAENAGETGTPVEGGNEEEAAKSLTGGENKPKIEIIPVAKGIGFAQYARAKICSQLEAKKGNFVSPVQVAKNMGFSNDVQELIQKATVGTTMDANFASALVQENRLVGEFVDMLRAATIFDKLKGMRSVPFNAVIPAKTKRGTASWVGQGAKKPMTNAEFSDVKTKEHKLSGITVYTQELMRRSDPAVDVLVRDDLIEAASILIDETFVGGDAPSDITPGGIFHGTVPIDSTGTTAEHYDEDLGRLEEQFLEANLSLDGAYYLMSETRAARMGRLRDALGNYYFQGMQGQIKELNGRPVITSETVGEKIGLIKTSEILLAQDGGVDVSYSDQATIENSDGTLINLWQENKFAVRVEKFITWNKRRPIAAAWIQYT